MSFRNLLAFAFSGLLTLPVFGTLSASVYAFGETPWSAVGSAVNGAAAPLLVPAIDAQPWLGKHAQPPLGPVSRPLGLDDMDRVEGPSSMGSFLLEPLNKAEAGKSMQQRSWSLTFSDFPMAFELRTELDPENGAVRGWTLCRPDGEAAARYGMRNGKLHLLSGQNGRQHETWLFDPAAVQEQAAGVEVNPEQAIAHLARGYARLLVNSFTKGTQPLFSISLLKNDLPEAFHSIGLPAFHPDAASRILDLDRNAVRKLEGNYASGTFAVVAPEQGLSVAAASGWIALVSAVWSEAEGYTYEGQLPYGHACNSPWDAFSLPSIWTLLQSQGAGESGTNHIYTTPMLPGLAMIVTQSADSSRLTGMTLLHQPYMQGSVPPSLLPPFPPEQAWPQHIKALQNNAAMDWVLLSPSAKQRRALVPPQASPLDSSALSSTVDGIPGALGFSVPLCPGSENPIQATCAQRLAEQLKEWLGDGYRMQGQFALPDGGLSQEATDAAAKGGWILVHQEDAGAMPADRKHPFWEVLLGTKAEPEAGSSGLAPAGSQGGAASAENSRFALPPTLEVWILPPGRR